MSEDVKCALCDADFRPNVMVELPAGVPKCPPCAKEFPTALSRAEIQVKTKNKAETFTKEQAKEIVYEILAEANIKRHKCETCGALFFRHKPMQKLCSKCEAGAIKKETK